MPVTGNTSSKHNDRVVPGLFPDQDKAVGHVAYCQELSGLPRNMEVNERALLATFAGEFDVANTTQDNVDPAKFEELAKNWFGLYKAKPFPGPNSGCKMSRNGRFR